MDRKEGEFESVGDTALVVDASKIVLDHLLFGTELLGNVLVFAALNDQGDDLHLLRGQTIANPCSDAVGALHGGDVGTLHEALSAGDTANAIYQHAAANVAVKNPFEEHREIVRDLLRVFCH